VMYAPFITYLLTNSLSRCIVQRDFVSCRDSIPRPSPSLRKSLMVYYHWRRRSLGIVMVPAILSLCCFLCVLELGFSLGLVGGTDVRIQSSNDTSTLPQIWYTSTPLAPDIGNMYLHPEEWQHTAGYTHAIKFYEQQMTSNCPTSACGFANLTYFRSINAFSVLKKLNLKIAIEAGALKDWDCVGDKALAYIRKVVDNVNASGSHVSYLDMDEPYFAGVHWCNLSVSESAKRVVNNFILPLRGNLTTPMEIGDIEPYPALSAVQIINWLDALKSFGRVIDHFHVDVDFHAVGNNKDQARTDMLKLRDYCDANNLTFAVIMNPAGFGPTTDQEYYDETMENVNWWIGALGPGYPSSRVIFQSWEPNVPMNVPETTAYTGTKVLLDSVALFLQP